MHLEKYFYLGLELNCVYEEEKISTFFVIFEMVFQIVAFEYINV